MLKAIIEREVRRYKEEYSPIKRELPENLNIAKFIDHTLLKADATPKMVEKLCEEAIRFEFWSVCVNTGYLPLVNRSLSGSTIRKTVVIGFPLGQMSREVKGFETSWACDNGADEFDMVINVGLLKSGEYESVFDDIAKVVESACGKTVKVIIETSLLTEEEKIVACVISREAGAAFVKTSTGFSGGGATVDDVSLMKFVVGDACKVKASGGVKSREEALAMISAGASRIGTSSGINIVSEGSKENWGVIEMDFCTLSLKDFLKKVAEKSATPGGGAVGAVVAALAASLGSMVANLTIGKKGYEDVEGHMESCLEVFESESNYLCDLMNRDIQAFDQVLSAYKLPKATDDEKNAREMKIQQALKTAIEVPFDLARRCKNIIVNVERLAKWGNSSVLSDAESAAHLLLAVHRIAKANVMINMKSLKDPDYGAWINEEMKQLEKQIDFSYNKIIEIIGKRNG